MKYKFFTFFMLAFAGFTLTNCGAQSKLNAKKEVQVVLLAGQSNMAGAGNYDELDAETKKRIEAVSNRVSLAFNGNDARPLSYFKNNPSEKYNFTKRFGPELLMGVTLAEAYPEQHFLLIKTSQGGTALYGAWNPNWSETQAKAIEKGEMKQSLKLFEKHVGQIEKELSRLKAEGTPYNIIGMAWMQGENDAILEVAAKNYAENLKTLIAAYRHTFDVENMPFVAGQTNSHYGVKGGSDLVRAGFLEVGQSESNVEIIETVKDSPYTDYPKHNDNVHYNAEGQKRLGIAFGNALIKLNSK